MRRSQLIATVCTAFLNYCTIECVVASEEKTAAHPAFQVSQEAETILDRYCYHCHDEDEQKGDIRLDNLSDLEIPKRLDLFNRMQEQLYFQHMPPKKKKQPSEADRKALLAFISTDLGKHQASTLEGTLQKPEFGNYVDHKKLSPVNTKMNPGIPMTVAG